MNASNRAAVRVAALLWLALALFAGTVQAHSASTAYLDVAPDAATLTARLALRDIDAVLDLDADRDGQLTWGEVDDRAADIGAWLRGGLRLSRGHARCTLAIGASRFTRIDSSGFLQIDAMAHCAEAGPLRLDYALFAGVDPSHRLLVADASGAPPRSLAPGDALTFGADAPASAFGAMFVDGLRHILGGIDHLLFLVALLLPAVLERRDGRWRPQPEPRRALFSVLWIATAFTVAHSLTLAAASLGWLRLPASIIEPLIAATVLAAALNNLWPVVTRRLAWVAFGFGLIHGFGFAEVLVPLALPPGEMARALLAFNLGVETGQIAVIAVAFTVLTILRGWPPYPRWVLGGGSAAVALAGGLWMIERVFNVSLPGLG